MSVHMTLSKFVYQENKPEQIVLDYLNVCTQPQWRHSDIHLEPDFFHHLAGSPSMTLSSWSVSKPKFPSVFTATPSNRDQCKIKNFTVQKFEIFLPFHSLFISLCSLSRSLCAVSIWLLFLLLFFHVSYLKHHLCWKMGLFYAPEWLIVTTKYSCFCKAKYCTT